MAHYFDEKPETPSRPRDLTYEIEAKKLVITSDQGVFSKNHIDPGSDLLIRQTVKDLRARGVKRGKLLDLGCGTGVIGIALKRLIPPLELTLSDVNQRALELTEINLNQNQIRYAHVMASDGFSALEGQTFDVIVTNPPIRAGKAVVYSFFEGAKAHLNPGGAFYCVIGKKQGAESAKRKLEDVFGNVRTLERVKGFFIFCCLNGAAEPGRPEAENQDTESEQEES